MVSIRSTNYILPLNENIRKGSISFFVEYLVLLYLMLDAAKSNELSHISTNGLFSMNGSAFCFCSLDQ